MADHRPSDGTDDWVRRNVDWIVGLLVVAVIVLSVLVWRMDNRIDSGSECGEVVQYVFVGTFGSMHEHVRQLSSGRYLVRISAGRDPATGHPITLGKIA